MICDLLQKQKSILFLNQSLFSTQLTYLKKLAMPDIFQFTGRQKTTQMSDFIQYLNGLKSGVMMNLDMVNHSPY